MTFRLLTRLLPALVLLAVLCASMSARAAAEEAASWRLEQPSPPPPPPGVSPPPAPVPLGNVGDIEFWEPPGAAPQANRGLLITHGNGDVVKPGVWAYDGNGWHEIATTCGATEGRIAWGGPADFWTVSDQRPGQAPVDGVLPPLADRSLCHFSGGAIVASYARLAFEPSSYEQMSSAACLPPQPPAKSSQDCWFGGAALAEPLVGSFHLHWNGSTVEAQPYPDRSDPVMEMRALENAIFESVAYSKNDAHTEEPTSGRPAVLHFAEAGTAMQPLVEELPLYRNDEQPTEALEYLRLGSSEGVLWAATARQVGAEGEGEVTVLRRVDGIWSQAIGPGEAGGGAHPLPRLFEQNLLESEHEEDELLGGPAAAAEVRAIAPEPGSEDAWLALAPHGQTGSELERATAVLVRISAQGEVLGVQTLPSKAERALPSNAAGAVARLTCPAREDCWMANASGWLYHLAREGERTLPYSELPGFPEGRVIGESERPADEGVPQELRDAPPPDTSGLQEEPPDYGGTFAEAKGAPVVESTIQAPLLSDMHSRLLHGTTLELRFHLAVRARVRLVAKRGKKVVAQTPMHTFAAGNRRLLLRLNRHKWPTKLSLQTHALAPLPSTKVTEAVGGPEHGGNGSKTETTGLKVLPQIPTFAGLGTLP
ncbi:MAG TPA: hypothetical protein VMB51_14520 [Solirubrobacteraceae bacterium]|nr:hypothetical protein [Solirubrobacteraceae bacterium]